MHRLFVALRPPPTIRALLRATMHGAAALRWQDDEQLHCTLRFIGQVERPMAEDIAIALSSIAAPQPVVAVAGVGRFDGRDGGAIWARLTPAAPLAALHRKVDQAMARIGLTREARAYLPHITIARVPRAAAQHPAIDAWLARHAAVASQAFTLDHLVLYESRLGSTGARYEAIARWPLMATP